MTDYCKTCFHVKDAHFDREDGTCSVPECKCLGYIHGETRVTNATGAQKGTKEERFDLIPVPALTYLARLYGKGAVKYDEHNWRLGYEWSKSYAAAQRHMNSFWAGEDIDPETGIPHVICASFHMFALATYLTEHPELDDRFETRESRSDEEATPDILELWDNATRAMALYSGEEGPSKENAVKREGHTLTIHLAPNIVPEEMMEQIKHLIEVRSNGRS